MRQLMRTAAAALAGLVPALAACQSTVPGPTQPRTATRGPAWVYHDGAFLWPGDYSFNAKPHYSDKEGAAAGGRSDIKISLTGPWGGFQPFARDWNFDLGGYAYLTFDLKPTLARQSIQVYFEKPGDVPTGVTVDAFKYGPAPVPGQWATYKIPLADLGVAGAHIFKFAIQDETGLANNVFYLDNIGFLPATP